MELSQSHKDLKDRITYNGFAVEANEIEKLYTNLYAQEERTLPNLKTIGDDKYNFELKFKKGENGNVYLNGFTAIDKSDSSKQQYFSLGKDSLNITSKEAYNLMEGRSVFKNLKKDEESKNPIWLKLDFSNKNENGQAKYKTFNKSYGYFPERMIAKMGVDLKYKKDIMKSLKKGNEVKITVGMKDEFKGGTISADPQFKKIQFKNTNGVIQDITSNIHQNTLNYLISNPKKQERFINSCTTAELKKISGLVKKQEKTAAQGENNAYEKTQLLNITNLIGSKLSQKKTNTKEQGIAA